mmetsp:Transcript_5034/g.10584  ORF Transcript_5034/g.10584 Transcript_5034/m.10584 type:complete len:93 (-) Transcript_5034:190-468(-)
MRPSKPMLTDSVVVVVVAFVAGVSVDGDDDDENNDGGGGGVDAVLASVIGAVVAAGGIDADVVCCFAFLMSPRVSVIACFSSNGAIVIDALS